MTLSPESVITPSPLLSDPAELRAAFGRFPSGVAALCARVDGASVGMVATSFSVGVSYDPPMVMFSVQNASTTWPVLRRAERIGISVLGSVHEQACMQLASRSRDRFAGLSLTVSDAGALFIDGSVLWLECEIASATPAGDHQIIVLEVKDMHSHTAHQPLVYQERRFHGLRTR